MKKMKKVLKWVSLVLVVLTALVFGFGYWFIGLIESDKALLVNIKETRPSDLPYLSEDIVDYRGKILAVVTSTDTMGNSGKATGYELTELSRAYYVFRANGFEVDIASPKGGTPPVIIDDMGAYDHAFLNDPEAQQKIKNSLPIKAVDPTAYEAVFFAGGKGAMFDFPDNPHIQQLVRTLYDSGKVVSAVCHGPAALVNVSLADGEPLLKGKHVSSFTNTEELFLIPDAPEIFPFLLQDKLTKQGAHFEEGTMYLENVVRDGALVTGQNPWSTWQLAEAVIEQIGYTPKPRAKTAEENAVSVLQNYHAEGYGDALASMKMFSTSEKPIQRELLAVHGIVGIMDWDFKKTYNLISLLAATK